MATDNQQRESMRAGDADRNEVADQLRRAVDEGRLSMLEYDERLRQAYAATTYGELEKVTSDLPHYREEKVAAQLQRKRRRDYLQEWATWLAGALIMNGIWLVTSLFDDEPGMNNYWPAIPLGIWAVILVAGALDGGKGSGKSSDAKTRRIEGRNHGDRRTAD